MLLFLTQVIYVLVYNLISTFCKFFIKHPIITVINRLAL